MLQTLKNELYKNKFIKYIYEKLLLKKWKNANMNNGINLKELLPLNKISITKIIVGKQSYGDLHVKYWGNIDEKLIIGNYCSIGDDCMFLLGGEHKYNTISTFPFKVTIMNAPREALTKGPIVLEDDVWIGANCLILSGITIGKGAVIGAGSVITKSIPPYSIVGGNPAKIIKYRFSNIIIEKLKQFDFSILSKGQIRENIDILYSEITEENVDEILQKLQK